MNSAQACIKRLKNGESERNLIRNDSFGRILTESTKTKQPLEVFARIRPVKRDTDSIALRVIDRNKLRILTTSSSTTASPQAAVVFSFKQIFDDRVTQDQVFRDVAFPLIRDLLCGQNGLLFTYGVTSAGKTYTVTGTPACPGIVPRMLESLFATLDHHRLRAITAGVAALKADGQNNFEQIDHLRQLQNEINQAITAATNRQSPQSPNKRAKNMTPNRNCGKSKPQQQPDEQDQWWGSLAPQYRDPPLIVDDIAEVAPETVYSIFASYVEIYQNYIFDLLEESASGANEAAKSPIKTHQTQQSQQQQTATAYHKQNSMQVQSKFRSKGLREDSRKMVYVQGVTEIEVKNAEEAFELFLKGGKRRRVGATTMNAESSRSHSVFTVRAVQQPSNDFGDNFDRINTRKELRIGQLSIVDLAGCERTGRTNATGHRLKEASSINNSLLTLRACFDALRDNQRSSAQRFKKLVPYRDSKLTHLFKSYFEGDGAVKMILCLNPGADDMDETLQVLRFGEQSQEIVTTNRARLDPAAGRFGKDRFRPLPDLVLPANLDLFDFAGPRYPVIESLNHADDNNGNDNNGDSARRWIDCGEKKREHIEQCLRIFATQTRTIRESLREAAQETQILCDENERTRNDITAREQQLRSLQQEFEQNEYRREQTEHEIAELDENNFELARELDSEHRRHERVAEQLRHVRTNIAQHIETEKQRLRRWCESVLQRKQAQLEAMKCVANDKIKLVERILLSDLDNVQIEAIDPMLPPHPLNLNHESDSRAASRPSVVQSIIRNLEQR